MLMAAIVSDMVCGNPMKSLLVNDKEANLNYIFWKQAQVCSCSYFVYVRIAC